MKLFFLALGCLELHLNEEALGYYLRMAQTGFERSTYVISQLALASYNLKGGWAECVGIFWDLRKHLVLDNHKKQSFRWPLRSNFQHRTNMTLTVIVLIS